MAFDFPNAPTTNQIVTAPDGTLRRWDGIKWVAGVTPTNPVAIVGDTPPSNPTPGTMWWDSVGCQMYVWFNDGNSSQWVLANNNPSGALSEAPVDGNYYTRQNRAWVVDYPSQGNVGRNQLHNGLFNVQQRGGGPWTTPNTYGPDRWV